MLVYVLNQDSKPLMPCSPAKARRLLKEQKAQVVKRTPFTIQLLYGSSGYKQPITLGVDAGSKVVGLSAVTEKKEVFSGELQLRNDIVELISTKNSNRRNRRNRKTRYRKPRFLNRKITKDWIAPSVRNKIEAHERIISNLHQILPITNIIIETASFDIQKIQNPEIQGKEYLNGPQKDFWNVRAYVLHRDEHRCHGKPTCKNKILQVHHIESRKTGGDAPNNLITICKDCHKSFHKGTLKLDFKREKSFRDSTFMGIMRKRLVLRLKACYPVVEETFGYLTKSLRIESNLEKSHRNDALCITNNPLAFRSRLYFLMKQIRKHNRQIHNTRFVSGGKRPIKLSPHLLHGFRLYDKVLYDKQKAFITSRRKTGYFGLKDITGLSIHTAAKVTKLELLETSKSIIWEMLK